MSEPNSPFPHLPPAPPSGSGGFPPAPPPPSSGGPSAPQPSGGSSFPSAVYQPPASPPPPYTGPNGTGTRSGMAVAALVLGLISLVLFITFLPPLLAVIFGLISASAIKKSGGRLTGLGMARAGWILGALGLAGFAIAVTAIAIDESNDTDVNVDELSVGSCYDLPISSGTATVNSLEEVSCDEPHDGELFHQYEMNPDGDRSYPGEDAAFQEAFDECAGDPWEDYVGISYEESEYVPYFIVPVSLNWKIDGGEASCFVVTQDESPLTESVRGSGR